jgi:hypothetical protein
MASVQYTAKPSRGVGSVATSPPPDGRPNIPLYAPMAAQTPYSARAPSSACLPESAAMPPRSYHIGFKKTFVEEDDLVGTA